MDNGHEQTNVRRTRKPLERDYGRQDLQRLLSFYLACIEEEDLRSLTLRLSQLHHSFLSPWDESEPLFYPSAPEVRFETKYKSDQSLLLRGVIQAGEPQRLFYGYPIFLDDEDQVAPLFFTEVEVRQMEDNQFLLHPIDPEGIQLNHHFLRRQHAEVEEIQKIQEYLEGPFGSFDARLKAAFEYIGVAIPIWEENKLDAFPGKGALRDAWYKCPILFRSERSIYTIHLRRELDALRKYPRFLEVAMDTALGSILSFADKGRSPKSAGPSPGELIEIRPLNMSQETALQSGFIAPLTVVTGPPGTGKSQVVVNLIANAVMKGKTILFASKNNKAVDVVQNWLKEILGPDRDWTFRVGSHDRMADLQEEMTTRLSKLSESEGGTFPAVKKERILDLDREIISIRAQIGDALDKLKKLGEAINERRKSEALVPETWVAATPENIEDTIDSSLIDQLRRETGALANGKGLGLRLWFLKLVLGTRLLDRYFAKLRVVVSELPAVIHSEVEQIGEAGLNWHAIAQKCQEVSSYIYWLDCCRRANDILSGVTKEEDAHVLLARINKLKEKKTSLSQEMLRNQWTSKIASERGKVLHLVRRYFDLSEKLLHVNGRDVWKRMRDDFGDTCRQLLHFVPSWIVTSLSARRALPLTENLFDLAVIDEASQCDIASALPILFRAKSAVIIGDPHQLRHISTLSRKQEDQIAEATGAVSLLSDWSYISNSLYDVAEAAIVRAGGSPIFLGEHYRSHPDIIEFSNRTFYARSLVLRTRIPRLAERLGTLDLGLFWHDVRGEVPNTLRSAYNDAETQRIVDTCAQWVEAGLLSRPEFTLGIVTPFRLQMEHIEEAVRTQPWFEKLKGRITVGTAHKFQGDEADLVFFSPVLSTGIHPRKARWVADTGQLLNVAITRARGALHVFGNAEVCQKAGGFLGAFAEYALGSTRSSTDRPPYESTAEEKLAELLSETGLWYHPQYNEGRYKLDFFVVSPFGTRYDLEVDGRQHWSAEQLSHDEVRDKVLQEAGYKIMRIDARSVLTQPDKVKILLTRLV